LWLFTGFKEEYKMPQAGIHGLVGVAVRKLVPHKSWLLPGIVFGCLLPDADNLAVAVATVAKLPTEGLHRTFTHSLFFPAAIALVFYLIAGMSRKTHIANLGFGLAAGVVMHILLDLLMWFDGVQILWPLPSWINLWENTVVPDWWSKLMMPAENLAFMLFFLALAQAANKYHTDLSFLPRLRLWTWVQGGLFVLFTVLVYTMKQGFMLPYGAVYLLSLGLALGVILRMRRTLEALS
jgi:membrane-bound metal-dependent hydrolase YbcI (DUF457 family)